MAMEMQTPTGCCPPFSPENWDGKMWEWQDKTFVKDSVFTLFHIPTNFGGIMRRLDSKIRNSKTDVFV